MVSMLRGNFQVVFHVFNFLWLLVPLQYSSVVVSSASE